MKFISSKIANTLIATTFLSPLALFTLPKPNLNAAGLNGAEASGIDSPIFPIKKDLLSPETEYRNLKRQLNITTARLNTLLTPANKSFIQENIDAFKGLNASSYSKRQASYRILFQLVEQERYDIALSVVEYSENANNAEVNLRSSRLIREFLSSAMKPTFDFFTSDNAQFFLQACFNGTNREYLFEKTYQKEKRRFEGSLENHTKLSRESVLEDLEEMQAFIDTFKREYMDKYLSFLKLRSKFENLNIPPDKENKRYRGYGKVGIEMQVLIQTSDLILDDEAHLVDEILSFIEKLSQFYRAKNNNKNLSDADKHIIDGEYEDVLKLFSCTLVNSQRKMIWNPRANKHNKVTAEPEQKKARERLLQALKDIPNISDKNLSDFFKKMSVSI